MTPETAAKVSQLHENNPSRDALEYEYFSNPDLGSKLFYAVDSHGDVVASQAFVRFTLIRNGEEVSSLMSERTLLSPLLRGSADYTSFYRNAILGSISAGEEVFIWGGTAATKAFQRFGFKVVDCFFSDIIVLNFRAVFDEFANRSKFKSKIFYSTLFAASVLKGAIAHRRAPVAEIVASRTEPRRDELDALLARVSANHPGTYFLRYSPEKLRWLVDANLHRSRTSLYLRSGANLVGFAIVEDRGHHIAMLAELLIEEDREMHDAVRSLCAYLRQRGYRSVRLWGNKLNAYVGQIREAFRQRGAVRLGETAQLVIRGAREPADHPAASELAVIGTWAPPA